MPRIYDAVYGYIELDEVEFALVNSPIFQRLHWIKQLGPLNIIFPSAQHSRFSHSIGVFHIMKKMMVHLERVTGQRIPEEEARCLKFAALLHDVGHVPFSHVGENVLEDSFRQTGQIDKSYSSGGLGAWKALFHEEYVGGSTKLHESLSAEIVLRSNEIDSVFKKVEFWQDKEEHRRKMREEIARMIVGKHKDQVYRAMLHSELDADRLDYLLRDSFFTGVEYGKIDLDYIISRFVVAEDSEGFLRLCLEGKGLHTIEHYLLGRFFLQTQVIFNRKVRFLDLVFADVMRYMVEVEEAGSDCHLMNLKEFLACIRQEPGSADDRGPYHRIYAYTDADVFAKMRRLHETLDQKEKGKSASEEEKYINDCIKIIMDGDVPNPVGDTHQIFLPVASLEDKEHIDVLRNEADEIARKISEKGTYGKRVKPNICSQPVMKHTKVQEEQANIWEAVRITYNTGDGIVVKPAAESNATILHDLVDKALLILNVYYVPSKSDRPEEVDNREAVIKEAYEPFIWEHFQARREGCGCRTGRHVCQIQLDENGLKELKGLVGSPKFICARCGRVATKEESLCQGTPISS